MNIAFDLTVTMGVIVTLVIAVVGWVRALRKGIDDRVDAVSARLDRHENRLTMVEQTITGLPGTGQMTDLRLELAGMKGELREMRAIMDGSKQIMGRLETIVSRHEDHLLDGARR